MTCTQDNLTYKGNVFSCQGSCFPLSSCLVFSLSVWSLFLTPALWLWSLHTCTSSTVSTAVCHQVITSAFKSSGHISTPCRIVVPLTVSLCCTHVYNKVYIYITYVILTLAPVFSVFGLSLCLLISPSTKTASQLLCLAFPLPSLHWDFFFSPFLLLY